MPEDTNHNQPVAWEVLRRNLVEALAEAEDMCAEFAAEMRAEAHQAWEEAERLSKETI